MADRAAQAVLTKGSRITGAEREALGARLAQRYVAGESLRALAEDTGRSFGFVHGLVTESGVPLRGRGGATRGPGRGGGGDGSVVPAGEQPPEKPAKGKAKARGKTSGRTDKTEGKKSGKKASSGTKKKGRGR